MVHRTSFCCILIFIAAVSVSANPAILNPSFEDVDKVGRPLHWKIWNNVDKAWAQRIKEEYEC